MSGDKSLFSSQELVCGIELYMYFSGQEVQSQEQSSNFQKTLRKSNNKIVLHDWISTFWCGEWLSLEWLTFFASPFFQQSPSIP